MSGVTNIIGLIKNFVIKHLTIILLTAGGILVFLIGLGIATFNNDVKAEVDAELANIEQQIEVFNVAQKEVKTVIEHLDHGLDTVRWQTKDDKIALNWITPAFSFHNASEYNSNRDIMISRLSPTDSFVTDFMPEYNSDGILGSVYDVSDIDTGENIACTIENFKTFVIKIDADENVYTYLAFITYLADVKYDDYKGMLIDGNGFNKVTYTVLMTYDIDKDGNFSNFSIIPVAYSGYTPKTVERITVVGNGSN